MTLRKEWDEYLFNMHSNTTDKFRKSTVYNILKEKVEKMEKDCKFNFSDGDYDYLVTWLDAVCECDGEEVALFISRDSGTVLHC